jgi:hypothetical protein
MHEFLQGLDAAGRRRGDAGAEALAQDREHARVDGIGLGQGADGLGKQTRTQRIDDGDRKGPGVEIAVSLVSFWPIGWIKTSSLALQTSIPA